MATVGITPEGRNSALHGCIVTLVRPFWRLGNPVNIIHRLLMVSSWRLVAISGENQLLMAAYGKPPLGAILFRPERDLLQFFGGSSDDTVKTGYSEPRHCHCGPIRPTITSGIKDSATGRIKHTSCSCQCSLKFYRQQNPLHCRHHFHKAKPTSHQTSVNRPIKYC